MKYLFLIFFLPFTSTDIYAQHSNIKDSLIAIVNKQAGDTNQVKAFVLLANQQRDFDTTINFLQKGLVLARKLEYKKGEADCLITMAMIFINKDLSETIEEALKALDIYNEIDDYYGIVSAHQVLQGTYREIGDYKNALKHAFEGEQVIIAKNVKTTLFLLNDHNVLSAFHAEISQTYLLANELDSAKLYAEKSISEKDFIGSAEWNFPYYLLATIQSLQKHYASALKGYRSAIPLAIQNGYFQDTLQIFSGMSTTFKNMGQLDSSIYYASMIEQSQNPGREIKTFLEALNNLAVCYKMKGNKDSALKYLEMNYAYKDSILGKEKERRIQNITFNEKLKQQEIISAQEKYKSRIQLYVSVTGLVVFLLITGILWRNNIQKQKAKSKIEKAYADLKSTQAQLIQSEKMASLGELTAGIAHEIQNPLNFVNNFSDLNRELINELVEEVGKGNTEEVKAIANDIKTNEDKINHHGKRAQSIVTGMLQHTRTSTGQKESTNINKLADEYLRLAYHGIRAKDKDFNCEIVTNFDQAIGNINIIPQDIGRVLLNLVNNAFYALIEKSKTGGKEYNPVITVSTKRLTGRIELTVADNGNGIPQKILDKIFQPFFTTKPTGQGTGLGLSLSYDIVKAHGGEIKVETKEGEARPDDPVGRGTEFIILLPVV